MKRKEIVDMLTAVSLIVVGSITLIFPLIHIISVKYIFIGVLAFYGIMNLTQFILTVKDKDFEGLYTTIASLITLGLVFVLDIEKTVNLSLILFVWITLMSLVKLKKCDYYHDRHKKIYLLRIITLILFILVGLLSVLNLYYEETVQILVLGFFYFVHGVLELVDPLTNFLIRTGNTKK